jgi:hypothetical protein
MMLEQVVQAATWRELSEQTNNGLHGTEYRAAQGRTINIRTLSGPAVRILNRAHFTSDPLRRRRCMRRHLAVNVEKNHQPQQWDENNWLLSRIESALGEWLEKEEDFEFPSNAPLRSRSATLRVCSLKAYRSLRQIVQVLQTHLCATKHLWVLSVQSNLAGGTDAHALPPEAREFVAWVYPDKILTIREDAYSETLQRLLRL